MATSWRERLRAASEMQREIRARHGDDADAVMAQMFAASGRSPAERTYREAMARNRHLRFEVTDLILPEKVLHPEETVLDVAVGALSSDTFPLLLVTDRRIVLTKDQPWRRWRILDEAAWADVLSAEVESRLISGRLRVRLRQGKDIVLRVSAQKRAEEVAATVRRVVSAGGAQPSGRG